MQRAIRIALIVLLGGVFSLANAQDSGPEPLRLDRLDWLVGRWAGEGLGGEIEEVFLPAKGSAMPATFRLVRGDRAVFYEFILLEETPTGVEMRLHHFNPGMTRWEEDPLVFDLTGLDGTSAVFAERDDEIEETRLSYRRVGDELTVELTELREGERRVTARFSFRLIQPLG